MTLVRTEISEVCIASTISMERISELGTTLAVTCNLSTLGRNTNFMGNTHKGWIKSSGNTFIVLK
jgi:hypothetical protein